MKSYNTVFFGTPDFAVESLNKLVKSKHNVCAVVTSVDKPAGRGRKLQSSPVKKYAEAAGIKVMQPKNLKDPSFIEELKVLDADIFTIVAFRMLPEVVWNMPPYGTVNVHASLLPNYRGAAPINHVLINGEEETGITTFKLQHEIDTGNILLQKKETIHPSDDAGSLHDRLMISGAELLVETLDRLVENKLQEVPQSEIKGGRQGLRDAPKLNKENTRINWYNEADAINNFVRGLSPYPGAHTELFINNAEEKKKVIVYRANPVNELCDGDPGTLAGIKKKLKVNAGKGTVEITELKVQGKKRMDATSFLNGNKISKENDFFK